MLCAAECVFEGGAAFSYNPILVPSKGVFGAVCQDLGISCKPEALRVYLRRPTGPDAPPPAMPAWDPIKGQLVQVGATLMADDTPTRQLGVPRAPLARSNAYQLRVQEKMNVALASLAAMHLEWDEVGPAVRALLGGTANYSPLDSELPLPWLHSLDVRMADLLRRSLHLGRAARPYTHNLTPLITVSTGSKASSSAVKSNKVLA